MSNTQPARVSHAVFGLWFYRFFHSNMLAFLTVLFFSSFLYFSRHIKAAQLTRPPALGVAVGVICLNLLRLAVIRFGFAAVIYVLSLLLLLQLHKHLCVILMHVCLCGTCGNLPVNSKYPQKTMSTNMILGNMLLTAQNVAGARWQCKCCHRRRCNYFYLLLLLQLLCGCCCFCG